MPCHIKQDIDEQSIRHFVEDILASNVQCLMLLSCFYVAILI
nr:MAG TPA: hypothetical protein [Bacteriophage sp.]